MAFQAICMLAGVFVCSICVKGSSQPQARVYLTFNGKKVDKYSETMWFTFFLIQIKKIKTVKYYWVLINLKNIDGTGFWMMWLFEITGY